MNKLVKESEIITGDIESLIFNIRGVQVMLDSDLALMYGVPTKRLNEQIRRNRERFPDDFVFQLTEAEWDFLRSQNATLKNNRGSHRKYLPFVFTEQGVAGLSGVLKSETAAKVHVAIMRTFVIMRKHILNNQLFYSRLDKIELKQLESEQKFDKIFNALENKEATPKFGLFYEGQIFDAYVFVSDLIKTAQKTIVLIDNYIDESVLLLLSKRQTKVIAEIRTKKITDNLQLDLTKHNTQYEPINVAITTTFHDRFLIIDSVVYHIGASLKDLGKKLFAFSKMEMQHEELLKLLRI